jgi:Ion channel
MFAALVGILLVLLALQDSFEVMVLPRRVRRRWRLTRFYYRGAWKLWLAFARLLPVGRYREDALSVFGPLSLLGLFACWVFVLIAGFALLQWGLGTLPAQSGSDLRQCLYYSGETFFTLGYGDVTPETYGGKFLAVIEAGTGFGFMALVIGYLPTLYQAFSHRERGIALLDARAGSPPTASALLRRAEHPQQCPEIETFLAEWELWSAELLESHLSFPVLSYYRSQHDNQSWLAALALVLDVSSALVITSDGTSRRRAELTFAMARHACVDLCLVFWLPPIQPARERVTALELNELLGSNTSGGLSEAQGERLNAMRALYEPFLEALSDYFKFGVPRFFPERAKPDNWQTSPWTERAPGITELPVGSTSPDEHFG